MWGEELTLNLFGTTILGSVIVAAIVEKLKTWLKTEGWLNTAIAFAVGAALGGLMYLAELLLSKIGMTTQVTPVAILLLEGIFSGGVAAGLWKALKTIGRKP
jgi:cell shape-determining protein MreD